MQELSEYFFKDWYQPIKLHCFLHSFFNSPALQHFTLYWYDSQVKDIYKISRKKTPLKSLPISFLNSPPEYHKFVYLMFFFFIVPNIYNPICKRVSQSGALRIYFPISKKPSPQLNQLNHTLFRSCFSPIAQFCANKSLAFFIPDLEQRRFFSKISFYDFSGKKYPPLFVYNFDLLRIGEIESVRLFTIWWRRRYPELYFHGNDQKGNSE